MQEKLILENKIEKRRFCQGRGDLQQFKGTAPETGDSPDRNRRITIVAYELEMNIIIHSYGGEIKVYISSEQIKVVAGQIAGRASRISSEKALQPGFSTADDEIRDMGFGAGMGLNNIQHYSDDVEFETGPGQPTKMTAIVNL